MAGPVRFTSGFTQDARHQMLGHAGFPNPFFYHLYQNDFDVFTAADWTITKTGTGTTALTASDGGSLLLTTTAGGSDSVLMQLTTATFAMIPQTSSVAGKKAFVACGVTLDHASNSTFYAGLIATSATPLGSTDGIYFLKSSGATTAILRNKVSGTSTDATSPVAMTTSYMDIGIYFNGKGDVELFMGTPNGQAQSGNRGLVARITPASFPSANLALSFGLVNGTAAARTATIDYILAARER